MEDSKEVISLSVRHAMATQKDVHAVGETSSGSSYGQIGRRIMQMRGFSCLISSISSDPGVLVVILDDDVSTV